MKVGCARTCEEGSRRTELWEKSFLLIQVEAVMRAGEDAVQRRGHPDLVGDIGALGLAP